MVASLTTMLLARSAAECRLYIDLHPCQTCGETNLPVSHSLQVTPDGELAAAYEGDCPDCDAHREFTFVLDREMPPPPPSFGGSDPSKIICPGQFMMFAENAASAVPLEPDGLTPDDVNRGRVVLGRAIAAMEEIIKFIPDDGVAVPPDAFTSPEGQQLYGSEPGRFSVARLTVVTDAYRQVLQTYDRTAAVQA